MKAFKNLAVKLLGNKKYQSIAIPLFSVLLSLIVGGVIIALMGRNPMVAYMNLLQGSGLFPKASYAGHKSMLTDFTGFVNAWTPMIFAALAVALALKTGLFNIGVSGQMLVAGFIASVTVGYSGLPAVLAKPLVLLVGMLVGALAGALVGWLKYRFNINEVVSTIMLNYIFQFVISFFINSYYVNPVSRQSEQVSAASRLTLMDTPVMDLKMDIPLGIAIAIAAAFFINFLMEKTVMGLELKSVGLNKNAARYAGIDIRKNTIIAMSLSGMLAGLAGVTYYLGYFGSIQPKVLPSMGFDSIAVSLLAVNNPIGIIISSFFITVISKGSTYMSSQSNLESEVASVITGIILLFCACNAYIRYLVDRDADSMVKEEV